MFVLYIFVLAHESHDKIMANVGNSVLAGHSLEINGSICQFKALKIG